MGLKSVRVCDVCGAEENKPKQVHQQMSTLAHLKKGTGKQNKKIILQFYQEKNFEPWRIDVCEDCTTELLKKLLAEQYKGVPKYPPTSHTLGNPSVCFDLAKHLELFIEHTGVDDSMDLTIKNKDGETLLENVPVDYAFYYMQGIAYNKNKSNR